MTHHPPDCRRPLGLETLVAYWVGELDEEDTQRVDEHLLGCEPCGAELEGVIALGEGVRRAFGAGLFGTVVGSRFTQTLAERGLRLREYRVERGGSVNCSIGPDDDMVIGRLDAPLAGVARLDMELTGMPGEPAMRATDIPFDAGSGEVVIVAPAARLRELPACVQRMRLLAVDDIGERVIGDYTFNHRPAS